MHRKDIQDIIDGPGEYFEKSLAIKKATKGAFMLCDRCYAGVVETMACKMPCTFCNVKRDCGDIV